MRWLFCHELLWKYSEVQSPNYSTWFSKGHPTVGHTSILLFFFFTSSVLQHLRWNTCFEKASACSPAPCCVQGQGTSSGASQMLLLSIDFRAQGCRLSRLLVDGTCLHIRHLQLGSQWSRSCALLSKPGGILSSQNTIALSFCWALVRSGAFGACKCQWEFKC